jgi:hypothetical protein
MRTRHLAGLVFALAAIVTEPSSAKPGALTAVQDLAGQPANPFASSKVNVLLFLRTDCPISKRYAPELAHIAQTFKGQPVAFWLVFADRSESAGDVRGTVDQYKFPGTPIRDDRHELIHLARATVAPEAAVFTPAGALLYHGRIDDRYVDIGRARAVAGTHDLEDAISAALAGKPVRRAATQAVGCALADLQ